MPLYLRSLHAEYLPYYDACTCGKSFSVKPLAFRAKDASPNFAVAGMVDEVSRACMQVVSDYLWFVT